MFRSLTREFLKHSDVAIDRVHHAPYGLDVNQLDDIGISHRDVHHRSLPVRLMVSHPSLAGRDPRAHSVVRLSHRHVKAV